jgi:methionine-rich copper-binding protein CopC
VLAWPTLALGHGTLVKSDPKDGTVDERPPPRVQAWFNSELESAGSGMTVLGPDGRPVLGAEGGVDLDDVEHASIKAVLPPGLPPGKYRVQWRTTSVEDGDQNEGTFGFEVK